MVVQSVLLVNGSKLGHGKFLWQQDWSSLILNWLKPKRRTYILLLAKRLHFSSDECEQKSMLPPVILGTIVLWPCKKPSCPGLGQFYSEFQFLWWKVAITFSVLWGVLFYFFFLSIPVGYHIHMVDVARTVLRTESSLYYEYVSKCITYLLFTLV